MTMGAHLIGPHEGRELALMLGGAKPLSLFYFENLNDDMWAFPEDEFDAQVSLGKFVKRMKRKELLSPHGTLVTITTVLYSLVDQTWRIDAYLFIENLYLSFGPGFRPDLERIIGNLLGYSSEEIEAFIDHVRERGSYMAY